MNVNSHPTGPVEALFKPPYHPCTEALLSAVPIPDPTLERSDIRLTGTVPSALARGLPVPYALPAQDRTDLRAGGPAVPG